MAGDQQRRCGLSLTVSSCEYERIGGQLPLCGFVGFIDCTMPVDADDLWSIGGLDTARAGQLLSHAVTLKKMSDTIAHRGPDSEGFYLGGGAALGFRRLSIIDLTGGDQPMTNEDGSLVLTFNGEIYNYRELKATLQTRGHTFKTHADSEVILHGYEEYGENLLPMLRGMFGFVIWDKNKKELLGARDYFGIKPFYYGVFEQPDSAPFFVFGSEIKGFFAHEMVKKELNDRALKSYMMFQYSPHDETFFKHIYKLRPGHYLKFREGELAVKPYFSIEYDTQRTPFGFNKRKAELAAILDNSVEYHQISDVEVGCFLSGGVDSSFIASVAKPAKSFSVGFDLESLASRNLLPEGFMQGFNMDDFDESQHAYELSKMLGIGNERHIISADEFFEALPAVQYHSDEPHANLSAVPLYYLARLAATRVKVVLSGEGADELFGGYTTYLESALIRAYKVLPISLRRAIGRAAGKKRHFKGRNMLMSAGRRVEESFIGQAFLMTGEEAEDLLAPAFREGPGHSQITAEYYHRVTGSDLTKKMYLDMHMWLPHDILLKADKMTMAHSLELRVPFLDREVWENARHLPENYRVRGKVSKFIFRKVAAERIPQEWAKRRKVGFPVPFSLWLKEEKYLSMVHSMFSEPTAARFFDQDKILNLLEEHSRGEKNNGRKIYTIYSFLIWHKAYFGE